MSEKTGSQIVGASGNPSRLVLRARGLLAEYTTGQAPSGEWFALGSVRSDVRTVVAPPALMLVGAGRSAEDAVQELLTALESEARRLEFAPGF